jgi:hypothetical protein
MPSQKTIVIAGSVVIAIMIISTAILYFSIVGGQRQGFDTADLHAPLINSDPVIDDTVPTPATNIEPGRQLQMKWSMTPVYSGYGGAITLTINNDGSNAVHIYSFGLDWPGKNTSTYRKMNITIDPHSSKDVGLLFFNAPNLVGSASYQINLHLAAQNPARTAWYDYGAMYVKETSADILALSEFKDYTVTFNSAMYFDKVNELVNYGQVGDVVSGIRSANSSYNIQEIISAFDWIRENIAYAEDPEDIWQSPKLTLRLGTGDCEDQAILMASLVGALGGNARVNIIQGHAFATVYMGNSSLSLLGIREAISSHYGCDLTPYFIQDSTGYWMTVDTTGFPYAGGLVTTSAPVADGINAWTFEDSDWMVAIDAIGN